jgi:hypothetical protein
MASLDATRVCVHHSRGGFQSPLFSRKRVHTLANLDLQNPQHFLQNSQDFLQNSPAKLFRIKSETRVDSIEDSPGTSLGPKPEAGNEDPLDALIEDEDADNQVLIALFVAIFLFFVIIQCRGETV